MQAFSPWGREAANLALKERALRVLSPEELPVASLRISGPFSYPDAAVSVLNKINGQKLVQFLDESAVTNEKNIVHSAQALFVVDEQLTMKAKGIARFGPSDAGMLLFN